MRALGRAIAVTAAVLALQAAGCSSESPSEPGNAVSLDNHVQPVFDLNCLRGCHRSGGIASFLDLSPSRSWSSLVAVPAAYSPGTLVVPGDPAGSVLWLRVMGASAGSRMPMGGRPLGRADQSLIRYWIAEGAPDN